MSAPLGSVVRRRGAVSRPRPVAFVRVFRLTRFSSPPCNGYSVVDSLMGRGFFAQSRMVTDSHLSIKPTFFLGGSTTSRHVSLSLSTIASALSRSPLRPLRDLRASGAYCDVTTVGFMFS